VTSEEQKKIVLDMEGHLSELRKQVEELRQRLDPAVETKYENSSFQPFVSALFCSACVLICSFGTS